MSFDSGGPVFANQKQLTRPEHMLTPVETCWQYRVLMYTVNIFLGDKMSINCSFARCDRTRRAHYSALIAAGIVTLCLLAGCDLFGPNEHTPPLFVVSGTIDGWEGSNGYVVHARDEFGVSYGSSLIDGEGRFRVGLQTPASHQTVSAGDAVSEDLVVSDPDANIAFVVELAVLDSANNEIGFALFSGFNNEGDFCAQVWKYADAPVSVSGEVGFGLVFDLSLQVGWNELSYCLSEFTNGRLTNGRWRIGKTSLYH